MSIIALGAAVIRAKRPTPTAWEWLKDLLIPLITPVLVVVLGFWFAIQSDQRQRAESERQRQTSAMRDVIVSQDRANTSFLIAIDIELSRHLTRYLSANEQGNNTDFDEEAAFFFYGMHRAALVNLRATAGNIVFPRVWMEAAFENLANHIVETILGATELDPSVSGPGKAAIYEYFGVRADSDRTGSERAMHSSAGPLLLKFHCLLHDATISSDPVVALKTELLKNEFRDFQGRLHKKQFDPAEVIKTVLAINALAAYAYNNIFADWYGTHPEAMPRNPPADPPEHFLDSRPNEATKEQWQEVRRRAWDFVRKFSPSE